MAIGLIALVGAGIADPSRFWSNLLLISYLLLGMGLAGTFFVALQYMSGASWSVAFRRIPEALSSALPVGAIGMLVVFFFHPSLYPWSQAASAEGEGLTGFKAAWLSLPFFWVRSVIYIALWFLLSKLIVRSSREQDLDDSPRHTRSSIRYSAMFLVAFGFTFWLASMDWIMSLEPHWYSTMFGLYNFSGLFLGGLAAIILLVLWISKTTGLRDFVNEEHLHDLGKLLFAFSTFWMYIWFCQYMLIWYANITEESIYYIQRLHGFWEPIFLLNIFLNWIIPFIVLLPVSSKRSRSTLAKVAIVVLAGRWVDLYLMIFPALHGQTPVFGLWEIGSIVGACGLLLFFFQRALGQASLVPLNDPRLQDSLHYHN
ncbi:MAG: hypothetical protein A3F68_11170 [Acidobacteria bacterium RIFCSPLOWO2_12_FULL_54_10]|nr:MAG: hypothetical protein A3F68_11170 [Acidobacteria bacterium RIFCSPLOWO2_12_FULL_54_10]